MFDYVQARLLIFYVVGMTVPDAQRYLRRNFDARYQVCAQGQNDDIVNRWRLIVQTNGGLIVDTVRFG